MSFTPTRTKRELLILLTPPSSATLESLIARDQVSVASCRSQPGLTPTIVAGWEFTPVSPNSIATAIFLLISLSQTRKKQNKIAAEKFAQNKTPFDDLA